MTIIVPVQDSSSDVILTYTNDFNLQNRFSFNHGSVQVPDLQGILTSTPVAVETGPSEHGDVLPSDDVGHDPYIDVGSAVPAAVTGNVVSSDTSVRDTPEISIHLFSDSETHVSQGDMNIHTPSFLFDDSVRIRILLKVLKLAQTLVVAFLLIFRLSSVLF